MVVFQALKNLFLHERYSIFARYPPDKGKGCPLMLFKGLIQKLIEVLKCSEFFSFGRDLKSKGRKTRVTNQDPKRSTPELVSEGTPWLGSYNSVTAKLNLQ